MSWLVRRVVVPSVSAVVLLGLSACGGKGGTGGTGGAGGGMGGGGAPEYGTSACGDCVEQMACVSQLNACAADPGCAGYLNCLGKCPLGPSGDADPTCEEACPPPSSSAGKSAQSAFVECRTSGPGTMCTDCGQIPKPQDPDFNQVCTPMTDTTPCYTCEDNHCCDTYTACHNDPECIALQMCVVACMDPACDDQCYQDHPAGFSHWRHREACILQFCADDDACGNAPLDPCVKCGNVYCADETAACEHDLQCTLLFDCETPCAPTDMACYSACETKFPDGMALLKAELDCDAAHCLIACGGS